MMEITVNGKRVTPKPGQVVIVKARGVEIGKQISSASDSTWTDGTGTRTILIQADKLKRLTRRMI